jgi:hypothetical protein
MALQYMIANGPMQTTAAFAKVATGTSIKTLLQVKSGATTVARIKKWGISFDGSAAATPGQVELVETGTVFATVTASVANDITKYNADALLAGNPTTALIEVGTAATGYTSTAEGSITASRNLDAPQLVAPTNQFIYEFSLGNEPIINVATSARIRVTFGTTVNAYCFMLLEI